MPRPVTISEDRILEAARTVFLRDGLKASTAEIARQAGVSEGSIFRRFPTKDALFRATVEAPPVPAWVRRLDVLVGTGDLRENLRDIAREIVALSQQLLPLVLMASSNRPGTASSQPSPRETPIIRDQRLLARYLSQEMGGGRLRSCDPDVVARMLFGTCLSFVMDSLVLKQPLQPGEVETFVENLIDSLWSGIAVPPHDR